MKMYDVGWGAISACNMRCQFCYSKDVRSEVGGQDVGLKEWIAFVDSNHECIDSINYGTGENSISDDWFRLIDYVTTNYPTIKQAITTNGTLYKRMKDNPKYEELVNKCISEIDVSLDFCVPEKHNELRGLNNAYTNAVNMLDYCKDKDIEATLVFIGIEDVLKIDNLEGIFDIAGRCKAKLRTNIFRPTNIDHPGTERFIAKYDTILTTLKWINDNHKILYLGDPLFSNVLSKDKKNIAADPSGDSSIRILSNGDITPSTYLINKEFRKYNIATPEVLKNLDFGDLGMNATIPDECVGCKYANECRGGVLDRRYLWYKTFNCRDPYCIYREGHKEPDFKVDINPDNVEVKSVHKDYLPTMFFAN